ncbi:MAG: peptidoglycan-binding domain-containing protein, partial [Actinomycetota bacterium]|nr:peptidoglycan-binding domain-containing protein [Actinomycetota bacterium]
MKKYALRCTAALIVSTTVPALVPAATPTASAVSCTVLTKNLQPGTTHAEIPCVESRLIELGFNSITGPDTLYGTTSVNAVKAFQSSRGLYPDGILTSVTARQLGLRGALPGPEAPRVTVIGDSTSAAMRWYDEANNNTVRYDAMGTTYDLQWSIESCRRLVSTSCVGRTDPGTGLQWRPVSTLPLMQTTLAGKLGEALVIMAGYDDTTIANAIDPIMAEAKLQGVAKVYWLNYRLTNAYNGAYQGYYTTHNANLQA